MTKINKKKKKEVCYLVLEQSTCGLILKGTLALHIPGTLAARLTGPGAALETTLFMHLQALWRSAIVYAPLSIDLIPLQHSDGTLNPPPNT